MERMEKDDILRKAQERKGQDEREVQVYQRSSVAAQSVGLIFCIILSALKGIAGQPHFDVISVYFVIASVATFYRWYYLRKRSDLLWGIVGVVIGCVSIAVYLWQLFF